MILPAFSARAWEEATAGQDGFCTAIWPEVCLAVL